MLKVKHKIVTKLLNRRAGAKLVFTNSLIIEVFQLSVFHFTDK